MGFKIKIKAPKIKVGDPSKLLTKATEGASNAFSSTVNAAIVKPTTDIASAAVGGVGQVMSQPGAGELLGAAGAMYGIPGLGGLASAFQKPQVVTQDQPSGIMYSPSVSAESNPNKMLYIGGGVAAFALIALILFKNKR